MERRTWSFALRAIADGDETDGEDGEDVKGSGG